MQNKTVIITGAGFSAPANIPIQNKILAEMTKQEDNILSVSDSNIELDNEKYLDAFVRVGLYLLINYANITDDVISNKFNGITNNDLYKRYLEALWSPYKVEWYNSLLNKSEHLFTEDTGKQTIKNFLLSNGPAFDEYFNEMIYIKGEIKTRLDFCKLNVSLEDVFTTFDKSISLKLHSKNFTYHEEDEVRQSILRLFVYYFGRAIKSHSFQEQEYIEFVNYIKSNANTSIITTNWDTLTEGYFLKNEIPYDICLSNKYYEFDNKRKRSRPVSVSKHVNLIKLHGSINWFRCLKCGGLSIVEKSPCGEYLFSTNKNETCLCCGALSKNNSVLLQPEIITPTMIKTFDTQIYKNIWNSAAKELREASKIIFIGYSMPTADFELKYFLQNNISPTTNIDVVLHKTDNPAQLNKKQKHLSTLLPEKRYTDAFVKNSLNFYYTGFKEYFSNALKSELL